MLKREVPPNEFEGLVPRNLLSSRYETSDVLGVHMVALVVGDGVHSGRCEERCHDQIIGKPDFLSFAKIFVTSNQIIIHNYKRA